MKLGHNNGKREGYSNPDEFGIPSFDRNLDVALLWIDQVNRLLDMEYIPMKEHVKLVTYKLKGRTTTW